MIGLAGNVRGRRASYLRGVQLLSVFLEGNLRVASYADILWARHAISPPPPAQLSTTAACQRLGLIDEV